MKARLIFHVTDNEGIVIVLKGGGNKMIVCQPTSCSAAVLFQIYRLGMAQQIRLPGHMQLLLFCPLQMSLFFIAQEERCEASRCLQDASRENLRDLSRLLVQVVRLLLSAVAQNNLSHQNKGTWRGTLT